MHSEAHEQRPSFQRVPVVRRPGLHLEGQLEHALDLLGAQGADLGDMAQGGCHCVAAAGSGGLCLQRLALVQLALFNWL